MQLRQHYFSDTGGHKRQDPRFHVFISHGSSGQDFCDPLDRCPGTLNGGTLLLNSMYKRTNLPLKVYRLQYYYCRPTHRWRPRKVLFGVLKQEILKFKFTSS